MNMEVTPIDWKKIFDKSSITVFIWTDIGEVLYVSHSVEQYGYHPDEFLNGKIRYKDIVYLEDYPKIHKLSMSHVEEKTDFFTMRYRIVTKWGNIRWVEDHTWIEMDDDGNFFKSYGILLDTTDKLSVLNALNDSNERFQTVVNLTSDIIYDLDLKHRKISWHGNQKYFLGLPLEELPENFDEMIELMPFNEWQKLERDFISYQETGNPNVAEYRFKDIGGKWQDWMINFNILINLESQNPRVVGSMNNISNEKRMKDKLELQQRLDYLSNMVEGLIHNFNNILAIVMGNLYLLNIDGQNLEKYQTEALQECIDVSLRAKDIINQLQKFAKHKLLSVEPVNLRMVIEEVKKYLHKTIDSSHEIKIEIDVDKEVFVIGNHGDIVDALLNLGTNAYHAIIEKMEQGSPSDNHCVSVKLLKDIKLLPNDLIYSEKFSLEKSEYCEIIFTDTGAGMTEDVKERIFQPYFTTKKNQGVITGQGLGLAMVFNIIIERCGGAISVESSPELGSTFHLFLPKTTSPEINTLKLENKEVKPIIKKVLIVDDEPQILHFLERALKHYNYEVYTASNGKLALNILKNKAIGNSIDLIILDLMMPEISGKMVIKELMKMDLNPKILISSGYSDENMSDPILKQADNFIQKPFMIPDLIKKIRSMFEVPNEDVSKIGGK